MIPPKTTKPLPIFMVRIALAIALIGVAAGLGAPANAYEYPKKIVLAGVEGTADAWAADVILREAYRRIGIELEIRKVPAARAIALTKFGQLDGEVQRIDAFRLVSPTLFQVTPAINFLEASVFSGHLNFEVHGWESITPFRIGIVRGIKFAADNTEGMERYITGSYRSLFVMLDAGRLDLGVVPRINGKWFQASMNSDRIRELYPPVARLNLFHYLHFKHKALVPILSAEIELMRSTGRLVVIRQHVNGVLMDIARSGGEICAQDYACFEEGLPAR